MRIGIIGAGQLGQMLGFAARDLNLDCQFIDPSTTPPAAQAGPVLQAAFDDSHALATLADTCDVITFEFENVPVGAVTKIADRVPVYPPPDALWHAQDRLNEKHLFEKLDIPLPAYRAIDSPADLNDAAATIGLPLVIKTRRLGYDGKGQFFLRHLDEIETAWQQLGAADLIAEQWIDFDNEVSAIGVRNVNGDIVTYPLTRNEHTDGILRVSRAPVENTLLTSHAEGYICRLLKHLDYVGVLTLELFVVGDKLLANEFAPRVHNSGHWSIEGAQTSQFANHLLAITNRPLGTTQIRGYAGMINLIGRIPDAARRLESGQLHDYGKQPRPGRKLGHITAVADSVVELDQILTNIERSVMGSTHQSGTGS